MNKSKIHFFPLFITDKQFCLNVLPDRLLNSHLGKDKRLNTNLCRIIAL